MIVGEIVAFSLLTLSPNPPLQRSGRSFVDGKESEMDTKEMKPLERYSHDPFFHNQVDGLATLVINDTFTMRELKEAVAIAQLKYELYLKEKGGLAPLGKGNGN